MTARTPPAHSDLRALAEEVAREAASVLAAALDGDRTSVETKSTSTDMVTEMDRRSEQVVVDRLLAARPDDGVRGEEGADRAGTSGVRWIVDPLDGTTNYLYRFPGFGVSVAAEVAGDDGWQVVAGAVVDVVHGATYSAALGGGATCNGAPVHASDQDSLAHSLVATGFSYDPARRERQAHVLTQVLPRVRDIRRMGAAAVDLCLVASGRVDAFYERGLAPWDHAAGALIAAEAGAVVGDLEGGPAGSGFVLAAAPAVFGLLRDLLSRAGAGDA